MLFSFIDGGILPNNQPKKKVDKVTLGEKSLIQIPGHSDTN